MERECMGKINSYCQRNKLQLDYVTVDMKGPSHDPEFKVVVKINNIEYGSGSAKSKKEAKAVAAKNTWEMIEQETGSEKSITSSSASEPNSSGELVPSGRVRFKDTDAYLAEKARDLLPSEKASPLQRNGQNSAIKPTRKLAANFNNANNKEEKKMSDSNKSLPNNSEKNAYTADERFLKDYKNIEPIGEGGFGNVFKATAKTDEMTYAVKRVELKMKVKREVQGLARLEHKYIVRYYCSWEGLDYVTYPDSSQRTETKIPCLFIQIEFCEQGTLEDWIEKNRKEQRYQDMAQNKFLQILEGVNYIHSKGLIHRDLKPQNIFISRDGQIKIGDFGLVTSVTYETLTGNQGTKSYMAPEQVFDKYGKEVDIYALGLIWFEILSALASHHEKNKVWPDVRESKFPEEFTEQFKTQASIIKKMLSKDASKRPRASEILELLKSVDKNNSRKVHTQ